MEYRQLGTSGLMVSVLGIGMGNHGRPSNPATGHMLLPEADTKATIEAALDAGITLFDTSDDYGESEVLIGKYLGGRRDEIVLASKYSPDTGVPLRDAVESSLRRLQTDHIDLYQMHEPDLGTPIETTLTTLTELVHEGKLRFIGSSKFAAWQIVEAEWVARTAHTERFIASQSNYSLISRAIEADILPVCESYGIGVIGYRPLAQGLLTAKINRDTTGVAVLDRLARRAAALPQSARDMLQSIWQFAEDRDLSILDVALGGLINFPGIASIIPGAMTADEVRTNVQAASWKPSACDLDALIKLTNTTQLIPQDPTGKWIE